MSICIIPARGGSKRIPRKNVKLFCGKPIIEWTVSAAQSAGIFERIIVSTDDVEIMETVILWVLRRHFKGPSICQTILQQPLMLWRMRLTL